MGPCQDARESCTCVEARVDVCLTALLTCLTCVSHLHACDFFTCQLAHLVPHSQCMCAMWMNSVASCFCCGPVVPLALSLGLKAVRTSTRLFDLQNISKGVDSTAYRDGRVGPSVFHLKKLLQASCYIRHRCSPFLFTCTSPLTCSYLPISRYPTPLFSRPLSISSLPTPSPLPLTVRYPLASDTAGRSMGWNNWQNPSFGVIATQDSFGLDYRRPHSVQNCT